MSKTHDNQSDSDVAAEVASFLAGKDISPAYKPDFDYDESPFAVKKKKSMLERIKATLQRLFRFQMGQ